MNKVLLRVRFAPDFSKKQRKRTETVYLAACVVAQTVSYDSKNYISNTADIPEEISRQYFILHALIQP
jgi:hypothetical protein